MTLPVVHNANQWMSCNASHQMQQKFPALSGEVSQSRLEGRACHEYAQNILLTGEEIQTSKDGLQITSEMKDFAQIYIDEVTTTLCNADLKVEQRVNLGFLWAGWYCIPDLWTVIDDVLYVYDAKFGHRQVPAENNWQLIVEAIGIIETLPKKPSSIVLTVVQPRSFNGGGPVSTWEITPETLTGLRRQLVTDLVNIISASPVATPGPQCRDCIARYACSVLQTNSFSGIEYVAEMGFSVLSGHNLGVELTMLKKAQEMIEHRLTGLEEQASQELKSGKPVSFFGLETTRGRRRWRKDIDIDKVIFLGDTMGVDLRKKQDVDTPAQAKKRGLPDDVLAKFTEVPTTGTKLIPQTAEDVRKIFKSD